MKRVVYTDKDGYKWVYEVPNDLVDEKQYRHGVLIGPPDLSRLSLKVVQRRQLHNNLCTNEILDYDDLSKKRDMAYGFIRSVEQDLSKGRNLLRELVAVYQQSSFGLAEEYN